MEANFEEIITRITDFMKSEAKTETVVGEPFQLGEFSCVPVIKVGMGFGTGGGETDINKENQGAGGNTGAGAGAGMGIDPIGFLVSRNEDISFVSTRSDQGLAAAFSKVPDMLNKFLANRNKDKEGKKDEKAEMTY